MDPLAELSASTAVWCDYRLERELGLPRDDPLALQLQERARLALDEALGRYEEHAPLPGEPDALGARLRETLDALTASLSLLPWGEALRWAAACNGGALYGDYGLEAPRWPGRGAFGGRFIVEEPCYQLTRVEERQWVVLADTADPDEGARWIVPVDFDIARLGADAVVLRPDGALDLWGEAHLRMICQRLLSRGTRRLVIDIGGFLQAATGSMHVIDLCRWLRSRLGGQLAYCVSGVPPHHDTRGAAHRLRALVSDVSALVSDVSALPRSAEVALERLA